jgi:putative transposase
MTLYKNRYRIESARCPNWDYTSNGAYFVTICTKHRHCFFGEVVDQQMQLSTIGLIVADGWQKIAKIRPYIKLDAWVVMPNHLHGIIMIANPRHTTPIIETSQWDVSTNKPQIMPPVETSQWDVSTPATKPRLRSHSLGAIVCQFKSACTKQIWTNGFTEFGWQTRYHDHIIRDEETADRIRAYILNNPAKWTSDELHPNQAPLPQ